MLQSFQFRFVERMTHAIMVHRPYPSTRFLKTHSNELFIPEPLRSFILSEEVTFMCLENYLFIYVIVYAVFIIPNVFFILNTFISY